MGSSQPSLLPPLLTQLPQPQPHTTPRLQSTTNPLHLPSNTELPMITQRLTSTPKKPQTARSPADLTKSTFPMAVYKLSHTRLMTTPDSSPMSATKVSQYTQKLSHTTQPQPQLTDTQPSSRSTLKNLPKISSVQPL